MDLNAVVEGRGRESYQALRAFLRSAGGRLFGSVSADRLDECYESFKDELARFARTLGLEERFQLYKDVRNLTVRIPENPVAVSCEYTLEKSFLTQDEINILILKLIHEPISQRELAESKLLCSRQAVSTRVQSFSCSIASLTAGNPGPGSRTGFPSAAAARRSAPACPG